MYIYAILEKPKDYPDDFVVRKWNYKGQPFPRIEGTAKSLTGARALIPKGMVRIPKQEGEDPVIVESYI